jgi:hypothetical protein
VSALLPPPSPSARRVWRVWQVLLALATCGLVATGILLRLSVPRWPWIAPDSGYYLTPALNGGQYYIGPRTFVYPMFCRLVLHGSANVAAVTIAQRVLGVLGPVLLFLAWTSLARRLWASLVARALHQVLGWLMLFLLVPSSISIIYEQEVLLECFNGFLQCCLAALLCLLWLPEPPASRRVLACVVGGLGIFMYYGNPRWGMAAPVVVAIASLAPLASGDSIRQRLRAGGPVLLTALAALGCLGFLQRRIVKYNPWDDTFTAKHLLWMHADLAANEFRRDLASPHPPIDAALLRKMIAKIDEQIVGRRASHWQTITFNANAMLYVPDNPDVNLVHYFGTNPDAYRRFCLRYYFRILWHQPRAYWGEVLYMLAYYYNGPGDDGSFRELEANIPQELQASVQMTKSFAESGALPVFRAELLADAASMESLTAVPDAYRSDFHYYQVVGLVHDLFLPANLAGAVCAGLVLGRKRWRERCALATLAWISLASILILFAQVLTLGMVTVTEGRYADALRPLAATTFICGLAMAGTLIWHVVVDSRKPRT